jgi:hypothetical protein
MFLVSWGKIVVMTKRDNFLFGEFGLSLFFFFTFCVWAFAIDDTLVIAVGSTSNTHGVPGLENSFQLKVRRSGGRSIVDVKAIEEADCWLFNPNPTVQTIPDAQAIRRRIMSK